MSVGLHSNNNYEKCIQCKTEKKKKEIKDGYVKDLLRKMEKKI